MTLLIALAVSAIAIVAYVGLAIRARTMRTRWEDGTFDGILSDLMELEPDAAALRQAAVVPLRQRRRQDRMMALPLAA